MRAFRGVTVATLIMAGVAVAAAPASSQNYLTRAVRLVVPSSPGSGPDFAARLIAPPLSERLGQQVVVDNRAGAATMIGSDMVAKSRPDGQTLLITTSTFAINPAIYQKMPYDSLRDFAPIAQMASLPMLLVVHPSLPAKSVKELVALARGRPGEITFASPGNGSSNHLNMELFLEMAGARMLHVPYKGPGPGIIDLMAGRISAMMLGSAPALPHIRSGKLRALGVTTARRAAVLPDVPTLAEAGVPGYEAVQWWGLLVSAGTATEIVARLHKDVVAVLLTQDIKERFAKEGTEIVASSPEDFAAHIRAEMAKWARVVKSAGIQPE